MALPEPIPGLVVRYSYLWYREHRLGRQEGQKDRPCAIVAALRQGRSGTPRVIVLPVTHVPPDPQTPAVEIPAKVKARLGLDPLQSWVVLSEWNDFTWPGPDLRRRPAVDSDSIAYGMLPPGLFKSIRDRFVTLVKQQQARRVPRS